MIFKQKSIFYAQLLLLLTTTIAILSIVDINCLPNIRILVNNENLQSPPYLLEAIKQVEANESKSFIEASSINQKPQPTIINNNNLLSATQSGQTDVIQNNNNNNNTLARIEQFSNNSNNNNQQESRVEPNNDDKKNKTELNSHNNTTDESLTKLTNTVGDDGYSLVKEVTIEEEILDDQSTNLSELVAPNKQQESSSSATSQVNGDFANVDNGNDSSNIENKLLASIIPIDKKQQQQQQQQSSVQMRKPSLPVTNAHLKKPANLNLMEEKQDELINSSINKNNGTGAKSLITASVAELDNIEEDKNLNKKKLLLSSNNNSSPPDLWEPNQIMSNVTNSSLIPATITKEYGKNSRTRITLGGGYVRDRLPSLVNPSSSEFNDNKPEKPLTPLESNFKQLDNNQDEVSRVIEIPERIILPNSPKQLQQQQSSNSNNKNKKLIKKSDPRCPKEGITTIEHPTACDKYYYCENGQLSEETCPNGLMYGIHETVRDYCVHRWKAVCDDKSIPNPISSPGCRWQFGIFNVQGSPKCSPDFYECTDGLFKVKKCSIDGQVYDDRTKSCQFAEQVGCAKEALADFQCPPDDQANTYWPFPRYFLNERALIHCINDKPEIVRCTNDERVDPEHLHCVPISKLQSNSPNLESRNIREKKKKITTNSGTNTDRR